MKSKHDPAKLICNAIRAKITIKQYKCNCGFKSYNYETYAKHLDKHTLRNMRIMFDTGKRGCKLLEVGAGDK